MWGRKVTSDEFGKEKRSVVWRRYVGFLSGNFGAWRARRNNHAVARCLVV